MHHSWRPGDSCRHPETKSPIPPEICLIICFISNKKLCCTVQPNRIYMQSFIYRSNHPSRTNKGSLNICPSLHMYVHTYIRKKFSDLNENWCVRRGRWVIHDGMLYDPIQGQGHKGPKVVKMADCIVCLFHQYAYNQETNGELWYSTTMSRLNLVGITWLVTRCQPPVLYMAYLLSAKLELKLFLLANTCSSSESSAPDPVRGLCPQTLQ